MLAVDALLWGQDEHDFDSGRWLTTSEGDDPMKLSPHQCVGIAAVVVVLALSFHNRAFSGSIPLVDIDPVLDTDGDGPRPV